ncbi:MAG TPA: IPTL-CTERM sorting domain-containing protein [Candidatus Polarisedimenticolia bacterium]|nr:IPTL-CTERM sorting domain-containing protein [Candidatus Polarisedimenticolia bacterium]
MLALVAIVTTLSADSIQSCTGPAPSPIDPPVTYLPVIMGIGADPNGRFTSSMATLGGFEVFAPTLPATCACGLLVPAGLTATDATVVDVNGATITGFTDFTPNATTTAAFEALSPAPPGFTWFGFATSVGPGLVNGQRIALRFNLTRAAPSTGAELVEELLGGKVGAAQSDPMGGNFDPNHQGVLVIPQSADAIPTLSQWGLLLLAAGLAAAAARIIRKRRAILPA